jgi:peptidoglycan/LPS O-acetylase OafA/YrhL
MPRKRERLDDGPYVLAIWAGLLFTGIYVLLTPENHTVSGALPNWFDNMLGASITIGAGLCLAGSQMKDWRKAYRYELGGLAIIIAVLGVLAVATDIPLIAQFTLAGSFGACIQIASLVMAANLWRALR